MALFEETREIFVVSGSNAKERLRIEKAFLRARKQLAHQYNIDYNKGFIHSWKKGVEQSAKWLESDGGKALMGSLDVVVSGMSACFSALTDIVQAELDIQTNALEKRYDAEISAAEGNNYKVKKLEKEKAAEEARLKEEANRKMFAMQVTQAIAQTAQGALAAYASAAAIPITGWIMAPIAASLAVAAGPFKLQQSRNSSKPQRVRAICRVVSHRRVAWMKRSAWYMRVNGWQVRRWSTIPPPVR